MGYVIVVIIFDICLQIVSATASVVEFITFRIFININQVGRPQALKKITMYITKP